jgi:hypothetical protein
MKLVDSEASLGRDIDAPENDRAPLSELNLNHFFRFRSIRPAIPQAHNGFIGSRLPRL